MFVRIALPTARVMNTNNSRCSPWKTKAVIKARREAKRVLRRDSRSHKQREEESVTSLVQMGGEKPLVWPATVAILRPSSREMKRNCTI